MVFVASSSHSRSASSVINSTALKNFTAFGLGLGMKQLIHQDMLGEWDREKDFWSKTSQLRQLEGVVANVKGPQAGDIELAGGLKAFFVPGQDFSYGHAENVRVKFYLGFSYEGLRAWSVQAA